MKEKVADHVKLLVQRELQCCSTAAHPAPSDEGFIWQGNAKVPESISQLKATFLMDTADSTASANLEAASPFRNGTSSTLQPEPPKPPATRQLAQEQVHPSPSRRCAACSRMKHVLTSPAARSFIRATPIHLQSKTAKATAVGQVARGSDSRMTSTSQSGVQTVKLHIVTREQAGTAVRISVKKITLALQAPTTESLKVEELYKQQVHVPIGWGSVAGRLLYLQQEQPTALNQAELQQEFYHRPTCHSQYAKGTKAYCDFIISMQTWKRGWFVLPYHAALERTNDAVWSQARDILLFRRRERHGSRLVTQTKRELYDARWALYPDHSCRQIQITSRRHLNPESRYSGKQGWTADNNLRLHSERLSSRKFQRGLPLLTACKVLEKARNSFLKKAEPSIRKPPPQLRTRLVTTTLEATARPHKTVGISRQTKALQAKSSLLLAENDGQKCTDLATIQNFLDLSWTRTFSPLLISPEQRLDLFVLDKFSSFIVTLPEKKTMSLEITSGEKPACQEVSISNLEATDVENSAGHYSSHTGVQDMCRAEPQESLLVFFQVEINKFINSFCLSVPLTRPRRSPFTEVGGSEGASEIAQKLLQGSDQITDSYDTLQEEVSSEANVVKVDREHAHTDSSLTLSPSKCKYETNNFLKSSTLNEDALESTEKGSSDIRVVQSIKHSFPSSCAPNDIAPSVRKTVPKNVVVPAVRDCQQSEKSPVEQAPSNGTEASCNKEIPKEEKWRTNRESGSKNDVPSSSEKRKSANEAASNEQDSRPFDISVRTDMLSNLTPQLFEKATFPKAENASSKTLTRDCTKVETPENVQLSGRKTSSKKEAVLLVQKEEPLYEELPYSWKTGWRGKKCPNITATDKQELSPQKRVMSSLNKIELANEAATTKTEPTAIEKSIGTRLLQLLARLARENAGVISKTRSIPEYYITDGYPDMEVASKTENSAQRATPQNYAPTSKPKSKQNEEPLAHATSSVSEVCVDEEITRKMGSPLNSPITTNFTKAVTSNAEPERSQQFKPELGQSPNDTSRTWQWPTTESATEPFSLWEKYTFPSRSEGIVPDFRRSRSHLWFSGVRHADGSSEVSAIPRVHIVEIGSAHDSYNERTSLEALSALLNQIEQRQKGGSIPLRDILHESVNTAGAPNAEWKSAENEQSGTSEAVSTLTPPVQSPGRSFRDVLQGIKITEPDKSATTVTTCAQPHLTCHSEGQTVIGPSDVHLNQNDPAPEYLAVGIKPPHMSMKAERIKIGSRQWIQLLKRKVMEPEHRERQPSSIDALQEPEESQGRYLKPEIVVVEFKSPSMVLSQQQEKHSGATYCQERLGSPRDFERRPACGNTPLRAADADTAVRKISSVARTSLCTQRQASAVLWQEAQNLGNYTANNLECDIPTPLPVPQEVRSFLPNSTCGNVNGDSGTDGAASQTSGYYTLWDVEPWLSDLHGNRHSPPLSISYTTNVNFYDNEDPFLQYFTNDNFSEIALGERDAFNCQSPCSHADGPLLLGRTETEMCSTESAINDTNATIVPATDSRDSETVQDDLCIPSKNTLHECGTVHRTISVSQRRKLPKVTTFRNLKKLFGLSRFDNTSQ
ncbi:hypothetical protein HPB50_018054 [Hyalomma asiaticum]|uniref:Uncharacterized protein n=1 Tax=Hyalomma asiaticum TaxID=266040 RepID=A0ACB7RRM8_HYAAI|nr:hypothetical protein HPB50_018054 [Hyalomma asiaticum]